MFRRVLLATVTLASVTAINPASAQNAFPAKPLRIVMPIPPGSALDVVTRVVGEHLSKRWGQQVLIENRPGAGGTIAAQAVASAAPDGHTLLGGASSIFTILPAQKGQLPFDVNRDFTQIGMIVGAGVMYVAVPPKLGINSFAELTALAKSKPQEVVVGTNGAGTLPHFAGLALMQTGKLPITVVPYNQGGTAAAIADIMGGRVHATIEAVFGLQGQLRSGDLKLIGAMSPERVPEFPDVPTIAETIPGLSAVGFMSLAAPTGTPEPIVRSLNEGLRQALETPAVKQRFAELGVPIRIMTPAQTKAYVENEQKYWWPFVRQNQPD
jgi:tripartite-type tricarboxylate transporter receptor subunit TctC